MTACIDYVNDVHEINIWLILIIVLLILINFTQMYRYFKKNVDSNKVYADRY